MIEHFRHRRTIALVFCGLAMVVTSSYVCRADVFYEQVCQLSPMGGAALAEPKRMRVYVRKGAVRVEDMSAGKAIIAMLDAGVIWAIDEQAECYSEIDLDEFSKEWKKARQSAGIDESGGEVRIEKGGDDRTVASYNCKHYQIFEGDKLVLELWVAESLRVPEKEDLYDYSERLGEFSASVFKAARKVKGFPLRMKGVKYIGADQMVSFREVTSLSLDAIDDAKFRIPTGYRKSIGPEP